MADIFISYTASDRDWAYWIAGELSAMGHTPHVHEWETGAGRRRRSGAAHFRGSLASLPPL